MQLFTKEIQRGTESNTYLCKLLYLVTYLSFPLLFIFFCELKLLPGIIIFQPESLPLVFLRGQFWMLQILSVVIFEWLYFAFIFER